MNKQKLKEKIRNNELMLGTFVRIGDAAVVEILGLAGLNVVVIDSEHAALDNNEIRNMIRAAEAYDCHPIVRVTVNDQSKILQALDAGAHGVQVPNVDSKDEAILVEKYSKFFPVGKRGFSAATKPAAYGAMPIKEYIQMANEDTVVIAHCETVESYQDLDEILKVDSIDIIFIGPMDLSQSLGIPGEVENPKMQEIIEDITRKTLAAGKMVGIAASVNNIKKYYDLGIRYMMMGIDHTALRNFYKKVVTDSIEKINS